MIYLIIHFQLLSETKPLVSFWKSNKNVHLMLLLLEKNILSLKAQWYKEYKSHMSPSNKYLSFISEHELEI